MSKSELTKLQRATLEAAAIRNDHTVFPVRSKPNLNAGSVAKLMKTFIAKGLAEERIAEGRTPVWRVADDGQRLAVVITTSGLAAIGLAPVGKNGHSSRPAGKKAPIAANKPVLAAVSNDQPRKPRAGTKLAILVALLEREGGATVDEMVDATGWQAHSVRGVLSGTLQKKFGLQISSEKASDGNRFYRLRRK
jgi:hypothetical protein